ncbi:phospholipase A [Coxiella-like endosymbiont]|uniref:phospholipase A n=1 Tax=Coxiella-like endosymbiont TaxID=1592897 RepID=UPI00272D30F0|nr:phospholipase A [Coxiella-like endosymbiont]
MSPIHNSPIDNFTLSLSFSQNELRTTAFLSNHFSHNSLALRINHQSNGQGDKLEKSWNRLFRLYGYRVSLDGGYKTLAFNF